MDDAILSLYMREITFQVYVARSAYARMKDSVAMPDGGGILATFAGIQSLLGAGAMVSKLLWPPKSAKELGAQRGAALRACLDITDDFSVLRSREVRNALEHFDERLDSFIAEGNYIFVDSNIGLIEMFLRMLPPGTKVLRHVDTSTGDVSVLDSSISINELCDAMVEVEERVNVWLDEHGPYR